MNAFLKDTLLLRPNDYGLAITSWAEARAYGSLRRITRTIEFWSLWLQLHCTVNRNQVVYVERVVESEMSVWGSLDVIQSQTRIMIRNVVHGPPCSTSLKDKTLRRALSSRCCPAYGDASSPMTPALRCLSCKLDHQRHARRHQVSIKSKRAFDPSHSWQAIDRRGSVPSVVYKSMFEKSKTKPGH